MRMKYQNTRRAFLAQVLLSAVLMGCEPRRVTEPTTFGDRDKEFYLTVLVDLSGSFAGLMAEQGKAYEFTLALIDRYFRERIGTPDTLVIAQISGNKRALLWEGRPLDLRKEFHSGAEFREFLLQKADPQTSLVHDGIANAIEYTLADPSVQSGKAKTALFVLSDMLENGPHMEESIERLRGALAAYGKRGGVVGLYYVNSDLVSCWRSELAAAGLRDYQVSSEIVRKPPLPTFE